MVIWALVGGACAAIGIAYIVWHKSTTPRRLAELAVAADHALSECRNWKRAVEAGLTTGAATNRWIPHESLENWLNTRPTPPAAMRRLAKHSSAGADARELLAFLAQDLAETVRTVNEGILADELTERRSFFDSIEKQPLTEEQASAVVTFDNRVQVVAAAGSGKTSVMVARAAYAVLRGFVPAERILLLAFNSDAAAELQDRVNTRLEAAGIDSAGIRASTFHSFGRSVIGRATGQKPSVAPWLDHGRDIEMVSQVVDELRDHSEGFRYRWDIYRLLFARVSEDQEGGRPDGYDFNSKETGFRTFAGDIVKSQGERMVADFLFLNGVKYQYERPYSHDVADADHAQYRPDFYYPDADVWHEHWALDRNGDPPVAFPNYVESMRWKKEQHRDFGTTLIETTWASILDQSGFEPLRADLTKAGLQLDWNPDRPISGTKPVRHEDLARLMRSFMAHVKSNGLTRDDVGARLAKAPKGFQRYRARLFLELYWEIHDQWQARLAAGGYIDFEDMLVEAAGHLERGNLDMGYELVLVDELQDASQARARLMKALVHRPGRYLLAVGDDWQSINRFAGADLSVMTHFAGWFGDGPSLRLQTTFRSPQSICDTASEFVTKNPRQLPKDVQSIQTGYGAPTSLVRVARVDEVSEALSSVLSDLARGVRDGYIKPGPSGAVEVDVLGRYRFDRDYMPTKLPAGLNVRFRTVHSAKGLEADYIVLPNVSSGTYGFPSELVDDPVLSLAMTEVDTFKYAEERRLFYVALTRARRHVTLIGVHGLESPFLVELLQDGRLELSSLSTVDPSEPCPRCGQGVLVIRRRRSDGGEFLACTAFPACTFTRPLEGGREPQE